MRNINSDDFLIDKTDVGNVILRWKHNRRRIRLFNYRYNPMKRAISYRDWLIGWYKEENYLIDTRGDIEKSQIITPRQ